MKKTLDDLPLYNSTFSISALESDRMGQRKRWNQTLPLQTEVMNSWFSCEHLHKTSHCNGHSKEAGESEATASIYLMKMGLHLQLHICQGHALAIVHSVRELWSAVDKTTQPAALLLTGGFFILTLAYVSYWVRWMHPEEHKHNLKFIPLGSTLLAFEGYERHLEKRRQIQDSSAPTVCYVAWDLTWTMRWGERKEDATSVLEERRMGALCGCVR